MLSHAYWLVQGGFLSFSLTNGFFYLLILTLLPTLFSCTSGWAQCHNVGPYKCDTEVESRLQSNEMDQTPRIMTGLGGSKAMSQAMQTAS